MYCVVDKDNIIVNIIEASEDFAKSVNAFPHYNGSDIGEAYNPPREISIEERIEDLERSLAESDEVAIELYEAKLAQEAINAEQDEAIIEIYEAIGGMNNG
jgi:hypothetical protein